MNRRKNKDGFTLVEVMIAIILIGIAVAGIVAASGNLTRLNGAGVELSTAEFLLEQVRERTSLMSFSSVNSLNGKIYSPPEDSQGQPLTGYSGYTQQITVEYVTENDLSQIDATSTSDFKRISVNVLYDGALISSGSWIRANY